MIKICLRVIVLLGAALFIASCFVPDTPQQVTAAFWKAVVNNDAAAAVKYSTLSDAKYFDGFSRDWKGYQAKWGRVIIDQAKASVVTEFTAPANSGKHDRSFITYLVRQDDSWKVDYDQTKIAINGGILNQLIGRLNRFGNDVSRQLDASSERFRLEMDRLSRQLEQMVDTFDKEAGRISDEYLDELRKNIRALEDSINRALRDDNKLDEGDRQVLRVAADNLQQQEAGLTHASAAALSRTARQLAETRHQLDSLESDDVRNYRQEWDELADKIEKNIRSILVEMQSSVKGDTG